jgi:6-bladed beta-propeller protein
MNNFELVPDDNWTALASSHGYSMVSDVAVSATGNVYALTREPSAVLVLDRSGNLTATWDHLELSRKPHGISVSDDEIIGVVDEGAHVVRFTDGRDEWNLQYAGPSDTGIDTTLSTNYEKLGSMAAAGGPPFNRPTKLSWAHNGDSFVTDGYGNCRVHHFDSSGKLVASWGRSGTGPGEFHLPHCIAIDRADRIFVADRDNDRIQVFDLDGSHLSSWADVNRPASVAVGSDGLVYVGELPVAVGRRSFVNGTAKDALPPRISVFDEGGQLINRWTNEQLGASTLVSPHGIAVDNGGSVYISQLVDDGVRGSKGTDRPEAAPALLRLVRN